MRKIFLAGIMLFAALTISAQSIVGKWKSDEMKYDEMNYVVFLTFDKTSNCTILAKMDAEMSDMKLVAHIDIPATYTLNDGQLSLAIDKANMKFKLDDISYSGEAAKKLAENPSMEGMIRSMVEQALDSNKDKMVEAIPLSTDGKVKITDTKLDIDSMVFHRVVE